MLTHMDDIVFFEWLRERMNERNMSRASLAKASRLSRQAISNYWYGKRIPNTESLAALAKGLGLPKKEVFTAAGIRLEIQDTRTVAEERVRYQLSDLTESQLKDVGWYIDSIKKRDERLQPIEKEYRYSREGAIPPEVVKKK